MKFSIPPLIRTTFALAGRTALHRMLPLTLGILVNASLLHGQQSESGADSLTQTIQALLKRVEQLEAANKQLQDRVAQLEGAQRGSAALRPSRSLQADIPSGTQAQEQNEPAEEEKMDVSQTLLNIRGFGDFGLYGGNREGQTTSFSLGELNLFITSNINDKFKFLTELVFEKKKNNNFEEDLERVLLEYTYNDYLRLSAGRYHTAIGYYNTAYHHTTWFETTTGRPFLFEFEDQGGILPIHSVGVSATGQIPSGRLGLHYVAEVSNGRASSSPQAQPVQNFIDENSHKALNVALFARPEALPGLQVGFSTYRDVLFPFSQPRIGETILDAYAVLRRPNFEWLNEALLIRHTPRGSHPYDTPGFYTQISESFGAYRPYFRYQYVNASNTEPKFPQVGLQTGPSAGLRYDVNESVALKMQYDYTALRGQPGVSGLGLQVGFTF